METTLAAFKESQLIGRANDKLEIIKKISDKHSQEFEVISIYGMGGLGKTTLVKHVHQSQELSAMFETLLHKPYWRRAFSIFRGGQSRPPRPRGHGKSWLNRGGRLCPPRLTDLPRRTSFVARRGYVR